MSSPLSVQIGESVIYQRLRNEAVLLEMNAQAYYGLDAVATEMWELLVEHHDVEVVLERLKAIYDVDEATVRKDLWALVDRMISAQLLKAG
jgi:hypothetical protein